MYKMKINSKDLLGNNIEETYYFNYNKAELVEMEMSTEGGIEAMIERIINEKDNKNLVKIFQRLILGAYGKRDADGIHFYKEDPIDGHPYWREFKQTDAYSELFMKLATDDVAAVNFLEQVLPADVVEESKKEEARMAAEDAKTPTIGAVNSGSGIEISNN